jgi:hypothetical protein
VIEAALGALTVGFVALAYLVIRMRRELQRCVSLQFAVELLPARPLDPRGPADEAAASDWPAESRWQPGAPAPLAEAAGGAWAVATLARSSADLAPVLVTGASRDRLESRYRLLAAVPEPGPVEEVAGVPVVALPVEAWDELPLPAAAMLDPNGVLQGVGSITTVQELLAFVHEGEHHGFGPAAELVPASSRNGDASIDER